jgi:probable F420-dependent oxidoreductase
MGFDFGVHYSCQAPDGNTAEVYQRTVAQAEIAADLGFSSFSVAEHHFMEDGWVPTPFMLLSAIAGVTDDVRVGTNVTLLPLANPIRVAERVAVLDLLSGGNARLGVSIGWRNVEFEAFGVDKRERGRRITEGMKLVSRLLTERDVTFDGDYYAVENLTVTPRPVSDVPIWCGGQAPVAIRRAAHVADSWTISPIESVSELEESIGVYEDALADAGRSIEDVHVPLRREVYVAEDDETAWEEAGEAVLREYQDVYGDYDSVDADFSDDPEEAIEQIRDHAADRFIVGGPETAIEQLERYEDAVGMDELLLRTHFPGLDMDLAEKSLRTISEDVMPHFE